MRRWLDLMFGLALLAIFALLAAGYLSFQFAPQYLERILYTDIYVGAVFIIATVLSLILERFGK